MTTERVLKQFADQALAFVPWTNPSGNAGSFSLSAWVCCGAVRNAGSFPLARTTPSTCSTLTRPM